METKDSRFLDHLTPSWNTAHIYTHTQILIKIYGHYKAQHKKNPNLQMHQRETSLLQLICIQAVPKIYKAIYTEDRKLSPL